MRRAKPILLLSLLSAACGGAPGSEETGYDDSYSPAHYHAAVAPDMDAVASAHEELRDKLRALEDEVSRFGAENWRVVVPDAEYALEQAEQALEELEDRVRSEGVGRPGQHGFDASEDRVGAW